MSNIQDKTAFWLDEQSISTKEVIKVLRKTDQIKDLVKELIIDQTLAGITLEESKQEQLIKEFREEYMLESEESFSNFLEMKSLNNTLLLEILSRPQKVVQYREERWGPRINSLYLKNKDKYDLVTYKRLESESEHVMQEVYFRLKDKEDTWDNLAKQFPNAPPGARIEEVPIAEMEPPIIDAIRDAGVGSIIKPVILSNKITVIAELESMKALKFDDSLRDRILRNEFDTWLSENCGNMLSKLRFTA